MTDTAKLVARVKTEGVTKATAELDKFGKEAKDAESSTVKFGKTAKKVGATVLKAGAAIGTAGTALVAISIKAADAQKEWQNLSKIAGDSVDNFKATAFATNQVGISAEKLADISKDTNEKLGEFIATGGGGFADFFNQVAPQVGLTAEELQGLSGSQVLGRVQSAMEQANVPMEQQSFYLESIASDTTALIPLLTKEGAELSKLTMRYNELNEALAISGAAEEGLRDLSTSFDLLQETSSNALTFITSHFAPDITKFINHVVTGMPGATQALVDFFDEFRDPENRRSISSINLEIAENLAKIGELQEATAVRGKEWREGEIKRLQELNSKLRERTGLLREEEKIISTPTFSKAGARNLTKDAVDKEKAERESLERRKRLQLDFDNAELESQQAFEDKKAANVSAGLDNVIALSGTKNKELFRVSQAAAIAQATISGTTAIQNALATPPYPLGLALAAAAAVSTGSNIAAIASQQPPSARQQGGQFAGGQDLLVGEKGPELVRFNSGGRISNTGETSNLLGGNAPIVTVNNNAPGTMATAETLSSGEVVVIVEQVLNREVNQPNSNFNKSMDRTRNAPRKRFG